MAEETVKLFTLPKPYNGTVEYVRDLLVRCESGSVIGITTVEEHPEGTYSLRGASTLSRLQTAGALLDAAVTRLKNTEE